jgi:hypothetical protein
MRSIAGGYSNHQQHAACPIIESVRWQHKHPDWRVWPWGTLDTGIAPNYFGIQGTPELRLSIAL